MKISPLTVALLSASVSASVFASHADAQPSQLAAPLMTGCKPVPACPELALEPGPRAHFRKTRSVAITTLGSPHHRARDLFQLEGAPQWLVAKFVYGKTHKDLEGEDVDVWVLLGCSGTWEKVATVRTSEDGTASIPDGPLGNGRVGFLLPQDKVLPVGLHRVRFVVRGDGSSTDALAEILAPNGRFFVSDVDGTLTVGENVELGSVLQGAVSGAHRDAPRILTKLAEKGYRPLYLSARAEALTQRTHEFLAYRGFPQGAVQLTTTSTGLTGDAAAAFKSNQMRKLVARGLVPSFGFGNRPSDTVAYEAAGIVPVKHRFFLGVDDPRGGRRFDSYTELGPYVALLPPVNCP